MGKSQIVDFECNCMNCRLERMEAQLEKIGKMVDDLVETRKPIAGMPEEQNKTKRTR